MEKIDLSSNSKQIQEAYDKVVRGDPSATYVVYTVDKSSSLAVEETGNGSLDEFVEHFTDGHIQFGLSRVTVPGSDVSKVLLLGWCPDNSPLKSRLSFATNFAEVSKVLSGYHIQITARDQDDLDVDEFVNRVGAAAGARYSLNTQSNIKSNARPAPKSKPFVAKSTPTPAASKPSAPSFVPKSTGKPIAPKPIVPKPIVPKPVASKPNASSNDDGWGGEKEIEERDLTEKPLEDVPSAYKPTKVNIDELRKQKSDTISSQPKPHKLDQPTKTDEEDSEAKPISERLKSYDAAPSSDGRLTSLPKPKVSHSVASRFTPSAQSSGPTFGSKPNFGTPSDSGKDKVVGGLSKNFASQGGKTPAQLWAEKRGQYKTVPQDAEPVKSGELEEKFSKASIQDSHEDEEEHEEEQEEEEEEEQAAPAPAPLPARNLPPPPVRQPIPEPEPEEEEDEEEEEKEEVKPSTIRNLPPPPVRNVPVVKDPEPVAEPEPEPEAEPVPEPSSDSTSSGLTAVAEYEYEKDEDNELAFAEGDLIVEIEIIDDDWCSGKHSKTGEVGLFPATYVVFNEKSESGAPAESSSAAPASEPSASESKSNTAVAEYDYEREEDNEISFAEGDLITDIEFFDEDWWSGTHDKTGEKGVFPANYVKLNA